MKHYAAAELTWNYVWMGDCLGPLNSMIQEKWDIISKSQNKAIRVVPTDLPHFKQDLQKDLSIL